MRRMLLTLGALAVAIGGVVACGGTPGVMNTTLGFTIEEGLLLLSQTDSSVGLVVLASATGNCPLLQTGAAPWQIFDSDFLTFQLQVQDANNGYLPLIQGSYNIVMSAPTGAGLFATSTEYETDTSCNYSPTGANSGTVTVQPFTVDAGGTSDVNYTVVFGLDQFTGAYPLTTCVVPPTATVPDAGTCLIPSGLL